MPRCRLGSIVRFRAGRLVGWLCVGGLCGRGFDLGGRSLGGGRLHAAGTRLCTFEKLDEVAELNITSSGARNETQMVGMRENLSLLPANRAR